MLEPGAVRGPVAEQRDLRVVHAAGGSVQHHPQRFERWTERDPAAVGQRELALSRAPHSRRVCEARRRPEVVLQHAQPAIAAAYEVEADDRGIAAGWRDA